ncbi:hypothetical protein PsorP6_017472 [Peronosclerospora sorghi]|uniref:Uncharacterized protein n=1 Tax=Peronosclerospora sorghi TaxID=230839 RepID=A0ACC0WP15_9STRA|nr:hypothetical protein PsorP6_017472 [Peronosclerospora sorghi]
MEPTERAPSCSALWFARFVTANLGRRFIENEHKETLAEMFKNANPMWRESGCNASSSMKTSATSGQFKWRSKRSQSLVCLFYLKNYLKSEISDAAKYGITQFEKNELWWVRNLKKRTAWCWGISA